MDYSLIIVLAVILIAWYVFFQTPAGFDWGQKKITMPQITMPKITIPKLTMPAVPTITSDMLKIITSPVLADKFILSGKPLLTVAQILFVDDAGNQLQYGNFKNIQASSQLKPYTTPDNALDGNFYFTSYPHVWHPSGSDTNAWMSAEFDSQKKIAKVIIYNRSDCCQDRFDGASLGFYNKGELMGLKAINSADFTGNKLVLDFTK
jgi:hypothetical protein